MNFEDIQKDWRQQSERETVIIKTDILLKEVQRNKQSFDVAIFWRDVREAGGSFAMMIFFIYQSIKNHNTILLYPAAACLFVGTYMVIDRIKLKRRFPYSEQNSSLKDCIKISLGHVNHQIWLLKNVAWWYLLPFAIGVSIPFVIGAWHMRDSGSLLPFLVKTFVFLIILYVGIYYLNQFAVSKELMPRKDELEALLKSIESTENGQH